MAGTPKDLWDEPVHKPGDPAIAFPVSLRRLELGIGVKTGTITKVAASKAFQDFVRKQIYTNQKSTGGTGFCACATRQMSLKHSGIINLGLSYGSIKKGLASETSPLAKKPGQWEYWHFNENVKVGGKPMFSDPDKLHPDAIAQVARNSTVGTRSTDRLKWTQLTAEKARKFLDEGAMVAVGTSKHWMTVVRDPFSDKYVYLDPYAETSANQLRKSGSLAEAPGWGAVLEYHALVYE